MNRIYRIHRSPGELPQGVGFGVFAGTNQLADRVLSVLWLSELATHFQYAVSAVLKRQRPQPPSESLILDPESRQPSHLFAQL